jgi:hypothetical protein
MPNSLFYVNPPPKLPLQQISVHKVPSNSYEYYVEQDTNVLIHFTPEHACIDTTYATPQSRGAFYLPALSMYYDFSWDKRRELKIDLQADFTSAGLGGFRVGLIHPAFIKSIGIDVHGRRVYFYHANAQGRAHIQIDTLQDGQETSWIHRLHIKHYPHSRDELWIDDTYAYSLTQRLPTGPSEANGLFYAEAWSDANDQAEGYVTLYIRYFEFYQER